MTKPERSMLITAFLATGLAFGMWAPARPDWPLWLITWLGADGLVLAVWWGRKKRRAESPIPVQPIPSETAEWVHEIRTPLMHIGLHIRQLRKTVPHESLSSLDRLEEELARVGQLLESLSILSQDAASYHDVPIRLDRWLQETLPLYRETADTLSHPLIEDIAAVSAIMARESTLHQILSNLLANAFRYAQPASSIRLALYQDGPLWVAFELSNPSIEPKVDVNYLSHPFVRGQESPDGAGLGLTVVERLTQAMGGRMHLTFDRNIYTVQLVWPRYGGPVDNSSSAQDVK